MALIGTEFRKMININEIISDNIKPNQIDVAAQQEQNAKSFLQPDPAEAADVCDLCMKGFRGKGRPNGYVLIRPQNQDHVDEVYVCPNRKECPRIINYQAERIEWLKRTSGLSNGLLNKTVNEFVAKEDYQRAAKAMTASYITESLGRLNKMQKPNWLYFGGQSGSGKTHLCAAVCNAFINKGRSVKYYPFTEIIRMIGDYDFEQIEDMKKAKILFIDDLFKIEPTDRELKTMFDVIDYRYRYELTTIIASERDLADIEQTDAAIAGRIIERCGRYFMSIGNGKERNYRRTY